MLASVLTHDGVLDRLQQLQARFDLYDTEGIHRILQTLDRSAIAEATAQEWQQLILRYLEAQPPTKDIALLSHEEKIALVHSFLISATFKDCSIIISFGSRYGLLR